MREQAPNPAPVIDRITAVTARRSRDADKLLMGHLCAHSAAWRALRHAASRVEPGQCNPSSRGGQPLPAALITLTRCHRVAQA
jgi:hypothetical protein